MPPLPSASEPNLAPPARLAHPASPTHPPSLARVVPDASYGGQAQPT
jgi:hypothetical protein